MDPLALYDKVSIASLDPIAVINIPDTFINRLQNDYYFNGYLVYNNNYIITEYNTLVFGTRKQFYAYLIDTAEACNCIIKTLSIQYKSDLVNGPSYSYQIINNNIYAELILYNNGTFQLVGLSSDDT